MKLLSSSDYLLKETTFKMDATAKSCITRQDFKTVGRFRETPTREDKKIVDVDIAGISLK